MNTRSAMLRAILENPACDTARLVMADVLDEEGEGERAGHIRWAVRNSHYSAVCLCNPNLKAIPQPLRERPLCPYCVMMGDEISAIPRRTDGDTHYVMNRGFVCELRVLSADLFAYAAELFARHPIERVTVLDAVPGRVKWFGSTHITGTPDERLSLISDACVSFGRFLATLPPIPLATTPAIA